ncbi:MAG: hypothetical protein KJ843_24890 [Alphaproteobacteria bacterium]|nr:hypothetical protein [Alphaproteobacteria bacterium]
MRTNVYIEDHAVPQLFTTAIEAFEFIHQSTLRGKGYDKLETFGLLWGYSIPKKGRAPARIVVTMATAETSAVRHSRWVQPNFESIGAKKDFFEKYWPHLELVGTFHSHPYEGLKEINKALGWRASEEDKVFWPTFHKLVAPEQGSLLHLVIGITRLERRGSASPSRLPNSEYDKGYVLSAEHRKLWLRSYSSELIINDKNQKSYVFADDTALEIPALEKRFDKVSYPSCV